MTQYILDTDTLSLLQHGHTQVSTQCAARRPSDLAITVISLEEQLSGWYTLLRRARSPENLARVYERLVDTVRSTARLAILPFTISAIARYEQLIQLKLNVRRMDLRIAAIALEHGGTLVTRNVRDFGRVPGLILEDWSI
jgi:tRNA(fMet)-specific endonuclease VapC